MFYGCVKLSSVTMLAPSDQITSASDCCKDWLKKAGTDGSSRTLKVQDEDAYNALVDKDYLPALHAIWKIGAAGTTVLKKDNTEIK